MPLLTCPLGRREDSSPIADSHGCSVSCNVSCYFSAGGARHGIRVLLRAPHLAPHLAPHPSGEQECGSDLRFCLAPHAPHSRDGKSRIGSARSGALSALLAVTQRSHGERPVTDSGRRRPSSGVLELLRAREGDTPRTRRSGIPNHFADRTCVWRNRGANPRVIAARCMFGFRGTIACSTSRQLRQRGYRSVTTSPSSLRVLTSWTSRTTCSESGTVTRWSCRWAHEPLNSEKPPDCLAAEGGDSENHYRRWRLFGFHRRACMPRVPGDRTVRTPSRDGVSVAVRRAFAARTT
jgi:hypothetical protein